MPRVDWALSPEQRMQAREIFALCEAAKVDPLETVRRGLEGKRAPNQIELQKAVLLFLRSRRDDDCRQATIEFYEGFLRPVVEEFGSRILDSITRDELADCIDNATQGRTARTSIARACRALWRWAMKQREPMASQDATLGLKFIHARKEGQEPTVLTVEQCKAVLDGTGKFRSALALMIYAGVRPEEVHGPDKPPILWKHISIEHEMIEVPAECAKTRNRRVIEGLPPVIWQWIEPRRPDDPISSPKSRSITNCAKAILGLPEWPQDCTRHTFASYMLNWRNDAEQVSTWMGHEVDATTLKTYYLKPGLRVPALRFLELVNLGAASPLHSTMRPA